jgi:probable phosphoglycerate mutase
MTLIAFIRHAETQWNIDGRMQGRAEISLRPESHALWQSMRAPAGLRDTRWHVSPLTHAIESARIIGPGAFRVEPRLTEMDWGQWEGETLHDLRSRFGAQFQENEDRGLHFLPHGGESPADVQVRLKSWFRDIADPGRPVTALTHKGVIRAVLALAYDWDMLGKPPVKLDWNAVHLFDASAAGEVVPVAMNIPFEPKHG